MARKKKECDIIPMAMIGVIIMVVLAEMFGEKPKLVESVEIPVNQIEATQEKTSDLIPISKKKLENLKSNSLPQI